jgi:hypothetical protein
VILKTTRADWRSRRKSCPHTEEARKYHFVSDLVGGKEKYDENLAEIHSLQVELDTLDFRAGGNTLGRRYREK